MTQKRPQERPRFILNRDFRSVFALADILRSLNMRPDQIDVQFAMLTPAVDVLYDPIFGIPADEWPPGTLVSYVGFRLLQECEEMMAAVLRKHKEFEHQLGMLCIWSWEGVLFPGDWEAVLRMAGVRSDDFIYSFVPEADNPWHALNEAFQDEALQIAESRELRSIANLSPQGAGEHPVASPVARCLLDPLNCRKPGVINHLLDLIISGKPPGDDEQVISWLKIFE